MKNLLCLAATLSLPAASHATIVFDSFTAPSSTRVVVLSHDANESSSTHELPGGFESESQSGHAITLAGTDRHITQIEAKMAALRISFVNSGSVSFATTLRIYSLNAGVPSSLLWEGTTDVLTLNFNSSGYVEAPIVFTPNMVLPDSFAVAFSHSSISPTTDWLPGTAAKSGFPTLGSSSPNWFFQDTASGVWDFYPNSVEQSLQLRITAIPAPSAMLLSLALLAGAHRRRAR